MNAAGLVPLFQTVRASCNWRSKYYAERVEVLIKIPAEHYDLFTAELPITSREYTVMKNSIVAGDPGANPDRRFVQILCDEDEARGLLAMAEQAYPAVVPYLRAALPVLVS